MISPFFSSAFRWHMTPLGDLMSKASADLAHRRSVAARLDLALDEVVNLALPFRQLAEVRHGPPLVQKDSGKVDAPRRAPGAIRSPRRRRLIDRLPSI